MPALRDEKTHGPWQRYFPLLQANKEQSLLVLSASQDKFYSDHMYSNYGDLGMAVKAMVDEFQKDHNTNSNIQSIQVSLLPSREKVRCRAMAWLNLNSIAAAHFHLSKHLACRPFHCLTLLAFVVSVAAAFSSSCWILFVVPAMPAKTCRWVRLGQLASLDQWVVPSCQWLAVHEPASCVGAISQGVLRLQLTRLCRK